MNETTSIQVNTDKVNIIKTHEFDLFKIWKFIPYYMKSPPRGKDGSQPIPRDFAENMGVDDAMMLELIECKTQKAFAEKYGVSEKTLVEWGKVIETADPISGMRAWAVKVAPNVLMSMYSNALSLRNMNADRDRLNFMKIAGWVEKKEVDVGVSDTLVDYLKKLVLRRQQNATNNTGALEQGDAANRAGPPVSE